MINRAYLPLFIAICHIPIFFLQFEEKKAPKLPKKKIAIHTIHLLEEPRKKMLCSTIQKPIHTAAPAVKKNPPKKVAPKKAPPKKAIVKKAPLKKPTPKKRVVKKPAAIKKAAPILSKKNIQKKLTQTLSSKKPHAPQKGPLIKKTTKNDAGKGKSEYNQYLQAVAQVLSDTLTLPEQGKVKLSITIRPSGKVSKIVSLSSESAYNLAYLEEHLAKIILPKYSKKEDRTFTIVFSDEK